jgi:hypothetical protein
MSIARRARLSAQGLLLVLAWPAGAAAAGGDAALAAFTERQAALAALAGGGAKAGAGVADRIFSAGFEAGAARCDADADADALPDCVETATGVFVDITDTGTDPALADSDGDGLSDGDEVVGSAEGLDLPALGVSPLRRDLLVELDWFEDAIGCNGHSHRPSPAVIDRVLRVFADAGGTNPDGSSGIHVVLDHGQGAGLTGGNRVDGYGADLPGTFDQTFEAIKSANFDPRRRGYFRYLLLPHRYNGSSSSSGYAEVVGDDAIVSMGCALQDDWIANTIIHELGHVLGLHHGGFEACNGKPNYNSLMNYRYQFAGVDADCTAASASVADLSRGERVLIDEQAVDEHQGVCGAPAIDWNGDGTLQSGLTLDLNPGYAASCGKDLRTLADFDDWANLTFLGLLDAQAKLGGLKQQTACGGAPIPKPAL